MAQKKKARKAAGDFAKGDAVKILVGEGRYVNGKVVSVHDGGHLVDVHIDEKADHHGAGTLTTLTPACVEAR
jgi:hypothetical protein